MSPNFAWRSLVVIALATSGLVAGGAQPSQADDSVLASVTITSPQDGEYIFGDWGVVARAFGQDGDPPRTVKFFIDHRKRPSATMGCPDNVTQGSTECDVGWTWRTHGLVGRHTVSAQVVLLDGTSTAHSQPVHPIVMTETRVRAHRLSKPVAGRMMPVAGRVISVSKGRPGVAHVPVTLTINAFYHRTRTLHLRTDKRGRYRTRIRARTNTSIQVETSEKPQYYPTSKTYEQYVRGRPRCELSRTHVRVKQFAELKCRLPHYPGGSKFYVQDRIHGKWDRGTHFDSTYWGRTKLYIRGLKPHTFVMREVFPRCESYLRSTSNAVRLHVA